MIVVRNGVEVLLGRRSAGHVFMPERYVFPGGAVDRGDGRVQQHYKLRPVVHNKLQRSCSAPRASALAMAAIRETWEETGLLIGKRLPSPLTTRSLHWQSFFATGYAPALDELDYVARAITPPGAPRRFDARFFLVDAVHAHGTLVGNGELEDLAWIPLDEALDVPLAGVTRLVMMLLKARLTDAAAQPADHTVPFYRELGGRSWIEHH